ncbi:DUF349 domain-containing protein [Agrococcus jejuensis]|uniref:DUF349 domain-containing protein n=1 Tax=Agrococcus jejuensis TaxID=399736 RepID=A0A1G7ZRZ8_9MICO|nr:DUF349 domain-containing protein [Agrococcus jejuensis]SDH11397.1 protein of unknown function [Agrococcus jejuensis]
MDANPWGRVDEHGTVSVREGEQWREVGQYPDASPDEALAYFQRKYADLEGQVRLLEQRSRAGASATDVQKAARHLRESVTGANAVGDLEALLTRIDALAGKLEELSAEQKAEAEQQSQAAIADREAIVAAAEALAARDPKQVQWKQASSELDALFQRWQTAQKDGPRIPKSAGDALWKRFRDARQTVEQGRRAFFSDLDSQHKDARSRKQALVERAQALAPKGADGIPAYRSLLDEWKAAGRAGRKVDDALWADFKAAGDVLFQAKSEANAIVDGEQGENLAAKRAILEEATPLLQVTDRAKARDALTALQRRWDEIGRVPREALREVEDGMRRIEAHVRKLDDDHWDRTNPERKARSEGLAGQLEESIEQLEAALEAAKASKDKGKVAGLEAELQTKREWLAVVAAAR